MKPDLLQKLQRCFEEVMMCTSSEEKAQVLERVKLKEPDLLPLLQTLLKQSGEAEQFFSVPLVKTGPLPFDEFHSDLSSIPEIPDQIGEYEILQLIGTGGMGEVYHARSNKPNYQREVALKVVKRGCLNEAFAQRLELECQALAMMNNDHVAKIYEVGRTADGVPFFTMEYLDDGKSITLYCDDNRLTVHQRAALFLQVCEGVSHAHQRGVIHGDLKPSNILITMQNGKPVVKIIDFGVAMGAGSMVFNPLSSSPSPDLRFGSLAYISPEQTYDNPEPDIRSDIYSLGIIFFELLTGAPYPDLPNQSNLAMDDRLRYVREVEHPKPGHWLASSKKVLQIAMDRSATPSSLIKAVRGDLDWIVARSLAKDLHSRFQTIHDLEKNLHAWLHHFPLEARGGNTFYRLRKFARRHWRSTVAAVAITCSLIVGILLSLSGMYQARAEKKRAEQMLSDLQQTQEFYGGILTSPHPYLEGGDVKFIEVLNLTDQRLDNLGRLDLEAGLRLILGQTYFGLGEYASARHQFSRCLELGQQLYGPHHPTTVEAMEHLAGCLLEMGETDRAEQLLDEVLPFRETRKEDHPLAYQKARTRMAMTLRKQKRYDQALELIEKTRDALREEVDPDHLTAINATMVFANILLDENRLSEARFPLGEALDAMNRVYGQDHPRTLNTLHNYAALLYKLNQLDEAEARFRELVNIRSRVLEPHHPQTLNSLEGLAAVLLGKNKPADAALIYRDVKQARLESQGNNQDTLRAMDGLATALASSNQRDAAVEEYQTILKTHTEMGREHSTQALTTINNLSSVLVELDRSEEALNILGKARKWLEHNVPDSHLSYSVLYINMGEAQTALNQFAEAVEAFDRALELLNLRHPYASSLIIYSQGYRNYCLARLDASGPGEHNLLKAFDDLTPSSPFRMKLGSLLEQLYRVRGEMGKADGLKFHQTLDE